MENNQAKWVLENLLDRITEREDGRKELTGVITPGEMKALGEALKALQDTSGHHVPTDPSTPSHTEPPIPSNSEPPIPPPTEPVSPALCLPCDIGPAETAEDYRICIDFGTAMSKVTLVHDGKRDDGGDMIEVLPLGEIAEQDPTIGGPELLISSVYISNDGHVYFGKSALTVSEQEADKGETRKRVDNIKRFLSEDGIESLLNATYNPTNIKINYEEILVYYLVYLTWIVNQCMEELGQEYNTAVLRRYAMPCFDNGKSQEYARLMAKMLGDAYATLQCLQYNGFFEDTNFEAINPFHEGIHLAKLKAICDAACSQRPKTFPFVDTAVTEPLGVASALVSEDGHANNLSMVIDIGAGTTDISMFRIRVDPDKDIHIAQQVPGTTSGFTMAGNYIDRVMTLKVLSLAQITPKDFDYQRAYNALERNIRRYKEALFEEGQVSITLANGEIVDLSLEQLMASPSIQEFQQKLQETVMDILERVPKHYLVNAPGQNLAIVLTGGGATLPFAQSVIGQNHEIDGVRIRTVPAHACPEWIEEEYPELIDIFPRIAVSLGGAGKNVINQLGHQ
ncbi:MAG: hypothetical protein ACQEW0_02205 [Pseudomonadota bacterium]